MTKNIFIVAIAVLLNVAFCSLSAQNVSKDYNVGDFSAINLQSVGNIIFAQSAECTCRLEGPSEFVEKTRVTVKNGTVKAAEMGSCAIHAYGSGASMTLENVTATVTSDKGSVTVGDFGSAVIKSGDYQGLYVGAKSQVTLEGGTFRPYMDTITNENVKSIFWKVNETTDATSRDCMELLGDGCVYVDENQNQVRTGGGFNFT